MTDNRNNDLTRTNARLADVSRRRFERDHFIFREHESGERAYIIAEGSVEFLKESDEGLVSLRGLKAGGMFGELALIDDSPRMASAKAINGPVELLEIDQKTFKKKLSDADPFTRGLINILADTARSLASWKNILLTNVLVSKYDQTTQLPQYGKKCTGNECWLSNSLPLF